MELQHMRYVLAIAEEQSFTRAAERCFVVQSSLSHQIKALEQELGLTLFARTSRRVELTAAGRAFLPAARASLEAAERAIADAAAATGHIRGRLTIGVIPTVTAINIPAALRGFRQEHPDVRIHLRDGRSDESASIRSAAAQVVAMGPLDALINNAAVFDQSVSAARTSADGHELFWATNHLGPTELTARLSPALAAAVDPRVVFVASKGLVTMPRLAIRFDALDDPGWFSPTRAYYHAKLAQVMTAVTLAERIGDLLDVSCLRVPAVRLDPARLASQPRLLRALYAPKNRFAAAPEQIARRYAELVLRAPHHARGAETYVDDELEAVALPSFARDASNRNRLWAVTQSATGDPQWAWPGADVPRT